MPKNVGAPQGSGNTTVHLTNKQYEKELERLQIELLFLQEWIQEKGLRLVVLFEGRDTAGKGGVIKRITELLNPGVLPGRGPAQAERPRADAVVLPALHRTPPGRRRDHPVRPQLVQPGRRRTGHGVLHQDEYDEFLRFCPEFERTLSAPGSSW